MQSLMAQPINPALTQATTVDAALNAVGASKAQLNTRLALNFDDIALPGPLGIQARSEIPGTAAMVLLVGAPSFWYGSSAAGDARPSPVAAAQAQSSPQPVVVSAWQVPAGKKPVLRASHPLLAQRQLFTLVVLAQGKWFYVVREAKLACAPNACKRPADSKTAPR